MLNGTTSLDSLSGLTDPTSTDAYTGDLGDGSGSSGDWLTNAISTVQSGANAANSVIGLINGTSVPGGQTKAVPSNTNGTPVMQPVANTTSSTVAGQNIAASWFQKIPMLGWVVAGVAAVGGILMMVFHKK